MGVIMIEAGPEKFAKIMSTPQTRAIAALDDMIIDLDTLKAYSKVDIECRESSFLPIDG
jgi:hypothetical protein